jgi:hypothetical protein
MRWYGRHQAPTIPKLTSHGQPLVESEVDRLSVITGFEGLNATDLA